MTPFKRLAALAVAVLLPACAAERTTTVDWAANRSGAAAATARQLHLNPPPAYCALDRSEPVDALQLQLLDKTVDGLAQVLAIWRNCADMLASRRGIQNFDKPTAALAALVQNGEPVRTPLPRDQLIGQLAAAFDMLSKNKDLSDSVSAEARRRFDDSVGRLAESLGSSAALGEMSVLDVRATDRNAVYLSMVTSARAGNQNVRLDNILAVTAVNGIIIEVAFFANQDDDPAMKHLLAFAQSVMSKLVSDNDHASQTDV